MKENIKNLWVAALRDPNAKQGRLTLEDLEGKQCCLGVLCRIAEKYEITNSRENDFSGAIFFEREFQILPDSVRNWAGIKSCTGDYENGERNLAQDNDEGKSFAEIADIIEREWKTL